MSWTHCAWASKQTTGSAINKLVLMMMADATSHDNPLLILRIKTLSEKCESSESSVKRAIKDLESLGLLICVERFFENTQQSNAYILVTNEINPSDAEKIAKENERSGCFFKIRGGGGVHSEPRVGSEGTQGGFTVTPRATPSSSLPSFKEPIATLASLTNMPPDEQQPESASGISVTTPSQTPAQAPDQPLSSRATPPPPSSAAPLPRQKRGPAIPPLDEFVTWAEKNHPGWEREAAEWHKRLASQDWINGAGKPILNAKSTFNTWMSNGWIKRLPQSQSAKRFLSPAEMQAQEEAAAQNYTPGFRS